MPARIPPAEAPEDGAGQDDGGGRTTTALDKGGKQARQGHAGFRRGGEAVWCARAAARSTSARPPGGICSGGSLA
ncbi:hypothetical protein Asru_0176_04 [Acidisphaera rubrifaciens HS-AP3]|uniref:Uncharacterized protein n=1 Tax=Acidisphaera rubrifaciens HS-AP3 TaxID=1231350 RepID=A0A0D6P696_9PROT|nr:hypothetical protein Asru_0176_04 [Acidisphaera rubrifaciens HS-AP3]